MICRAEREFREVLIPSSALQKRKLKPERGGDVTGMGGDLCAAQGTSGSPKTHPEVTPRVTLPPTDPAGSAQDRKLLPTI